MNYFNTNERKGVLGLLLIIVSLQLLYFFIDFSPEKENTISIESAEIQAFQHEIDSLKQLKIEQNKPRIYPFNPSFITDYKGYKLGMSKLEIDRLLAHRKAGKYINSPKEFQQITKISDSLLSVLEPNFKFPDWVNAKRNKKYSKKENYSTEAVKNTFTNNEMNISEKQDLNTATTEQFQKIYGIGVKLAARIIKYREVLQGYSFDDQLYEVWYLDKEVADRALQRFTVIEKPEINKIDINSASFKEVLHLPYIDYDLTKKIFEYRDELAEYQSLEELKNIADFPLEKFDRISLYLTVE